MATCPFCDRQMLHAESCTKTHVKIEGEWYEAVAYGSDDEDWPTHNERCHDCGVKEGGTHHPGCDVERVPPDAPLDHDQMLWHRMGEDTEIEDGELDPVDEATEMPLDDYPDDIRDTITAAAERRFAEKVPEYGEGKNWLDDDPRYHYWKARHELDEYNVSEDPMHLADALNHMLFLAEITKPPEAWGRGFDGGDDE